MLVKDIIKNINMLVGNMSSTKLTYKRLEFYINATIDYINNYLETDFRSPTQMYTDNKGFFNTMWSDVFIGVYSNPPEPGTEEAPIGSIYYDADDCKFYIAYEYKGYKLYREYYAEGRKLPAGKTYYDYIGELNYDVIKDYYISFCLVYNVAVLFLEEEDEFEDQHNVFQTRVDDCLAKWKQLEYSDYEVQYNPYRGAFNNTEGV